MKLSPKELELFDIEFKRRLEPVLQLFSDYTGAIPANVVYTIRISNLANGEGLSSISPQGKDEYWCAEAACLVSELLNAKGICVAGNALAFCTKEQFEMLQKFSQQLSGNDTGIYQQTNKEELH